MYEVLVAALGTPTNVTQENFLYMFGGFILAFLISCMFDLAINMTKR